MKFQKQLAVFVFLLLCGCNAPKVTWVAQNKDLYKDFITAYSSGWIERGESFAVEFTQPVVKPQEVGKQWKGSNVKMMPNLVGVFRWTSATRLAFEPELTNVNPETEYSLVLDLKPFFDKIPDEIRMAGFKFRVAPVSMHVNCGLPEPVQENSSLMNLMIRIKVNEVLDFADLEKLIRWEGPGTTHAVPEWSEDEVEDGGYNLLIRNIQRLESKSEVVIRWKSPGYNAKSQEQMVRIAIPAKDSFEVTGVSVVNPGSGIVRIFFSEILDNEQNIQGLIKIDTLNAFPNLTKDQHFIDVDLNNTSFPLVGNLTVMQMIKSRNGKQLGADSQWAYALEEKKPEVRFIGKGSILPYTDQIIMPFEAINLNYVDVEVFKIFTNNVLYDLHFNFSQNSDHYNLVRLGRVIKQQTIQLSSLNPGSNRTEWKRYGLDLSKIIKTEAGAMYELRISFKPSYTEYHCANGLPNVPDDFYTDETGDPAIQSFWRDYAYYDYNEGYDYGSADNPCSLSYYYSDHFGSRTFYASNIAMTVKSALSASQCYAFVYNLQTGEAVANAKVSLYDAQLQSIYEGSTDGSGMIKANVSREVHYAVAKSNNQYAYLELEPGRSISQSEFAVDGVTKHEGMKFSCYTERGVWRPGDTISFNAIAFHDKKLPDQLPIQITVTNPRGKIIYQKQANNHLLGLYNFEIPIAQDDPTGSYVASLKTGNYEIHKTLMVETVKPNNIRVDWNIGEKVLLGDISKNIQLQAKWLHGSEASLLQAQIKWKFRRVAPEFEKYSTYQFMNPERANGEGEIELFNGKLDEHGRWKAEGIEPDMGAPCGDMNAQLVSLITETSGELNTDYYPVKVRMFDEYLGIKIPEGPYGERSIESGKEQQIKMVVLDPKGQPIANRSIEAELFEVNYEWWYEMRSGSSSEFQFANSKRKLQTTKLTTDRQGIATLNLKLDGYKRYFLKATNLENSYESGDYFYTGWSDGENSKNFVNILSFKSDKQKYQVGEKAQIILPGANSGQYVVHVIRGNEILRSESLLAKPGQTIYELNLDQSMAPNVYIDISYIQGIKDKTNDLPQRLYGVIPVLVEDTEKKLLPVLEAKDVVRPEESFEVTVKEQHGKEMAYQLFLVDEGLLNLTRFKTPQPYDDLMAKEALALLTWDNFDAVIGNLDAALEGVYSIGGDMALNKKDLSKVQRFKPVVLKSGPMHLKAGEKKVHRFTVNNYIGSLRAMVVANNFGRAGSGEKSLTVRKELMVHLAMPRTLTYKDELEIPVTVFVKESSIKSVQLTAECTGALSLMQSGKKDLKIEKPGDYTFFFPVKSHGTIGASTIKINAVSGSFKASHSVDIVVTNPNPLTHKATSAWIEPGKSFSPNLSDFGMAGTRKASLDISGLRNFSINQIADRLIRYPHGCLEQTTSALFPQALLDNFTKLTDQQKNDINDHIAKGVDKLRRFQLPSGGMAYWPGAADVSDWNTSYAGHFLLVAKNHGHNIPSGMLEQWYNYQKFTSQKLSAEVLKSSPWMQRIMAYKLYTMALYGKPNASSMNVMYQYKDLDLTARAFLAAAYCINGKCDIGKKLLPAENPPIKEYREYDESFGSTIRDEAILVIALSSLGYQEEAASKLNALLSKEVRLTYLNTQEMSFLLLAVDKLFGGKMQNPLKVELKSAKGTETISFESGFSHKDLDPVKLKGLSITNQSDKGVTVTFLQSGIEELTAQQNDQKGIQMSFHWVYPDGRGKFPKPGDKMEAIVNVRLTNYAQRMDNLALTINFPSTFELINERLGEWSTETNAIDYQDIRDNQVKTYFSLTGSKPLQLKFPVHVSYPGKYASPLIVCESMYDPSIYAKISTPSVEVRRE